MSESVSEHYHNFTQATSLIRSKLDARGFKQDLSALVVLGSGLGPFADTFKDSLVIPYEDIPHFKPTSVSGHTGELVIAKLNNKLIAFQKGRLHRYEGHTYNEINFPIRCCHLLGAKTLVLTNSAGSLNLNFNPGDLVMITDHLNFSGMNPLLGKNLAEIGPRFPDMTEVYCKSFRNKVKELAKKVDVELKEGIYFHVSGPSYETPAEIRMFRQIGGDMVGMSTVPEAIAGKHCGMKVLGLSCITNYGAGIIDQPLNHEDVKIEALKAMSRFTRVVRSFLETIE